MFNNLINNTVFEILRQMAKQQMFKNINEKVFAARLQQSKLYLKVLVDK